MHSISQTFKIALSNREKEILAFIEKGLSSKEIADKLSISKFTVDNHRRNMLKKRKSHNHVELVGCM